jgi:hypothetical protein
MGTAFYKKVVIAMLIPPARHNSRPRRRSLLTIVVLGFVFGLVVLTGCGNAQPLDPVRNATFASLDFSRFVVAASLGGCKLTVHVDSNAAGANGRVGVLRCSDSRLQRRRRLSRTMVIGANCVQSSPVHQFQCEVLLKDVISPVRIGRAYVNGRCAEFSPGDADRIVSTLMKEKIDHNVRQTSRLAAYQWRELRCSNHDRR